MFVSMLADIFRRNPYYVVMFMYIVCSVCIRQIDNLVSTHSIDMVTHIEHAFDSSGFARRERSSNAVVQQIDIKMCVFEK